MAREWTVTTATVSSCRLAFFESDSEQSAYVVDFDYWADGTSFGGSYKTGTPVEIGHQFEISYNPDNPRQNTGSYPGGSLTNRIVFWTVGACLAAVIFYFSEKYGLNAYYPHY